MYWLTVHTLYCTDQYNGRWLRQSTKRWANHFRPTQYIRTQISFSVAGDADKRYFVQSKIRSVFVCLFAWSTYRFEIWTTRRWIKTALHSVFVTVNSWDRKDLVISSALHPFNSNWWNSLFFKKNNKYTCLSQLRCRSQQPLFMTADGRLWLQAYWSIGRSWLSCSVSKRRSVWRTAERWS
jgi:hypothetical protein